jgi:stage IV sporulation protein FB
MLLGSPEVTAYDLRFRLLGIPVRVHPLFWLLMLLISGTPNNLMAAVVFVGCAFVSVLIHEMGHGLSSRAMGNEPVGIVLYAMGGFCQFMPRQQTPGQRLFVLLMGPGAGFILLILVMAAGFGLWGIRPADALALAGFYGDDPLSRFLALVAGGEGDPVAAIFNMPHSPPVHYAFVFMIRINLLWGVLNLLPIWPLDGGQIFGVVAGEVNPRDGQRWTHIAALLTAGAIAVWWASHEEYMLAVWFGYFGFINYQALQSLHQSHQFADQGDWWRR